MCDFSDPNNPLKIEVYKPKDPPRPTYTLYKDGYCCVNDYIDKNKFTSTQNHFASQSTKVWMRAHKIKYEKRKKHRTIDVKKKNACSLIK